MSAYCQEVRKLEGAFDGLELTHVLRNDNNEADELAKMGSRRTPVPTGVFIQQLYQPTISEETTEPANKPIEAEVLTINPDWTTPYLNYLLHDELPEDRAEAERIARRSRRYVVVGGEELYHIGTSSIPMRCISEEDGQKLLKEIHSGICGNHAASRTLVGKVSFGQPPSQMPTNSSANVRDASISLGRYTCQRKNCRPSQSPGLLRSGASIWSAPCREHPVVTHTSSSPSINSPSGSKPNPPPRSQPPRPRNSSKTLWSDSAFPIGSSRTTAHSS